MGGMTAQPTTGAAAAPVVGWRVLVVEDDATVAEVLVAYLRRAGMTVAHLVDGRAAVAAIRTSPPDLLLLDLMLPGLDGLQVCRQARALRPDLPVVMLTAKGEVADRIQGLEAGADDYVLKPFSPREVTLRVESVLRRARGAQPDGGETLRDGGLVIDRAARSVTLGDRALPLTNREFDLLAFMVGHAGQAFSREQLLREVWGWELGDLSTVTVHVRRLRTKVEADASAPHRLVTVWGLGYRWDSA
jgi:DNA-binding response OmpR family regulator